MSKNSAVFEKMKIIMDLGVPFTFKMVHNVYIVENELFPNGHVKFDDLEVELNNAILNSVIPGFEDDLACVEAEIVDGHQMKNRLLKQIDVATRIVKNG